MYLQMDKEEKARCVVKGNPRTPFFFSGTQLQVLGQDRGGIQDKRPK
jgi:hypothetical protein